MTITSFRQAAPLRPRSFPKESGLHSDPLAMDPRGKPRRLPPALITSWISCIAIVLFPGACPAGRGHDLRCACFEARFRPPAAWDMMTAIRYLRSANQR